MEHGETVEDAACREVREETCLVLDPGNLAIYGVLSVAHINEVYISLIAPLPSMEFATTREASDLRLLSEAEVTLYPRAFSPGTDPLIHKLYARLRTRAFKSTPGVLMQIR
jgi:ADP-ribose pyrophosphatase YjhB (NUDIX family)